jgi:excisionase family DNA binding protein
MMPEWITTSEAAELSGYTLDHLRALIREKKITARKFGIVWQIDRKSVIAYLRKMEELGERRGRKPTS